MHVVSTDFCRLFSTLDSSTLCIFLQYILFEGCKCNEGMIMSWYTMRGGLRVANCAFPQPPVETWWQVRGSFHGDFPPGVTISSQWMGSLSLAQHSCAASNPL